MNLFQITIVSFLGIVLLATSSQAFGGQVVDKESCQKVSQVKTFPLNKIKNYIMQTKPIKAFMFTTVKNKTYCTDPNQDWVKKAIEVLELKAKIQNPKPEEKKRNKKIGKRKRRRQNNEKKIKELISSTQTT